MKSKILSKLIIAVSAIVVAGTVRAQSFNPVALTPGSYNEDIIVESNTPTAAPYGVTCTQGAGATLGDYTFFEQGLYHGYNYGFPLHGSVITNESNANIQYVMPPDYTTNNCLFIDSGISYGNLALNTPITATNLSILGTSGGGATTIQYVVNHADYSSDNGTITFDDWYNDSVNFAWTNSGRVDINGNFSSIGDVNGNPRLHSAEIPVSGSSPIVSIDFYYSSGSGHAGIYAISGNTNGPSWVPIPVSGFNEKVVIPAAFPVTATMDKGTNLFYGGLDTWFEKGYATPQGYPDSGLPHPGDYLTNVLNPDHVYQMAPDYTMNNAVLIDASHQTVNLTPATPAPYSALTFLQAGGQIGGNNVMTNLVIVQHANGVVETNFLYVYDWFATNSHIAYVSGGRVDLSARTLNNLNPTTDFASNPKLFETEFGLSDTVDAVTNIILQLDAAPATNSSACIFAIGAAAGAVAPVISSQPSFINVFEGGGATFSVSLAAGTSPLVYQWQKDGVDLTDGGAISGSTSSSLTVSPANLNDDGQYQVIITNVAGAVTSAPIALTVMSTNTVVTQPGDAVAAYQPNGGSSPANEGPDMAIDGTTYKYLNYGANGGAPFYGPVGFVVVPSQGSSIITAARFYCANDNVGRDPVDYYLEGSTDGSNFTYIASGYLNLPAQRNPEGLAINPLNQALSEVDFANATSYSSYRVSFNSVKDPNNANSMQIAEVELIGTLTATPVQIITDVHPTNVVTLTGYSTTLSVAASGTPPIQYQWMRNGADIVGATNQYYTFPAMSGTNLYSCTVGNNAGPNVTSGTATVVGMDFNPASAFVVNFQNAQNGAAGASFNYSNIVYVGQGAYSDPSNNVWNGWESDNGFPGPSLNSSGGLNPIGLSLTNVGFNNGGLSYAPNPDGTGGNIQQGKPGFILAQEAGVNNGNVGGFILTNVPSGLYDLYLYGANYDNDRGANFTVDGITQTVTNNPTVCGYDPATNFVEGLNYVVFHSVAPDTNGVISGTWDGMFTNSYTGQSGEGCFDALQLVHVSSSVLMSIKMVNGQVIVSWLPNTGQLQTSDALNGTFTNITGAVSPYTNDISTSERYYRVKQ